MPHEQPDPWLSHRMYHYAAVRRAETTLHPAVQQAAAAFLQETQAAISGNLTAATFARNGDAPAGMPGPGVWARLVERFIAPAARTLWRGSFARTTGRDPATTEEDQQYTASLTERMAGFRRAVADRLARTLRTGRQRGETPAQLRERVAALMTLENWDGQVMTMTRTETMAALNSGAMHGALAEQERTGETWEKRWQSTHDQRVRDTHRHADGQIRPLHDPFTVGGDSLQFPGDPRGTPEETINCRCGARYAPAGDTSLTAAGALQEKAMPTPAPPAAAFHGNKGDPGYPLMHPSLLARARDEGELITNGGGQARPGDPFVYYRAPQPDDPEEYEQNEEDEALFANYSSDGYSDPMAGYLRRGESDPDEVYSDEELDQMRDAMDRIAQRHTVAEDIALYRIAPGHLYGTNQDGDLVQDDAFMSTSVLKSVADAYRDADDDVVMRIDVPAGLHAIPNQHMNPYGAARGEVVLPRGTTLQRVGTEGAVIVYRPVPPSRSAEEVERDDTTAMSHTPGTRTPGRAARRAARFKTHRKREEPMTTATAPPTTDTDVTVSPSGRWSGVLGFMDEWSADQRMLATPDDGVRSRPLPLPLLVQGTLASGHDGSELGVGVIDRIWTDGNTVMGEGRFDMDDPVGAQLARKVGLGFIRFVSLDVDDATAKQVLVNEAGQVVENGNPRDRSLSVGDVFTGWRVMGATLLAHPAFPNAQIALADTDGQALTAAAFAEIVGYNPEWGCVKPAGDGWEAADCTDPDAVPAGPDGTPYDAEQPQEDPAGDETPPAPDQAAEIPEGHEESPDAAGEGEEEAPSGCVKPAEDGSWEPADCYEEGAVPANADGTGPAEEGGEAARMATAPQDPPHQDGPPADCEPCRAVTVTAAASGTLAPGWTPPAEWFQQPASTGAHSITVDPDTGRVSGYLASWSSCHVGFRDRCVTPPRSATDYSYFNLRPVKTSDGTAYCGLLTMDTGHAALNASAQAALAHYDNTGTQAAVVRVGEDNHGIWAVGATLPFLTEEQRLRLSLASFSGDWREIRGGAELIAALAVNSPGFPLAAQKTGADNQPYALVAAGALPPAEPAAAPHPAPLSVQVDTDEVAAKVVERLEARQQRRERASAATGTLAALRQTHHQQQAASSARRVRTARSKITRVAQRREPTTAKEAD